LTEYLLIKGYRDLKTDYDLARVHQICHVLLKFNQCFIQTF